MGATGIFTAYFRQDISLVEFVNETITGQVADTHVNGTWTYAPNLQAACEYSFEGSR
jgi:hypothetical protein